MWQLARSVAGLLHWWWRCDRIRASPSEGRLLRLCPPCYLRIADESAEMVSRHVNWEAGELLIVHDCRCAAGAFELVVQVTDREPVVRVRRHGREETIAGADVEVIPGTACSRQSSS